jgi:OFA family oxalate/formate antiporter-like MFS transporter
MHLEIVLRESTISMISVTIDGLAQIQVFLFWISPDISSVVTLTVLTFIILMCYGGGFGTMPAFTADYFGPRNVGPIYGLMLTA